MAKVFNVAAAVAATIFISALLGSTPCEAAAAATEDFVVEGKVYCDTCRIGFVTPLSRPISGAKLNLKCANETTNKITLEASAQTDKTGAYKIVVGDDHDEDICTVTLVESGDSECKELLKGIVHTDTVSLTRKNGITQLDRYANPLGFATKEALPNCTQVLLDMGVYPDSFFAHY